MEMMPMSVEKMAMINKHIVFLVDLAQSLSGDEKKWCINQANELLASLPEEMR